MSNYEDEKVLKQRDKLEREKHTSIEQGMYVGEQLIYFKMQKLYPNGFQIVLPELFRPMEPEQIKLKYPMEQRPQIIWTNDNASTTFTFSLSDEKVQEAQLEQIRESLCGTILSVNPHYIFTDKGKEAHEKGLCWWAEFLSPVLGGMLYSIFYAMHWEHKLILGMFNCPTGYRDDWKPIVLQLMRTVCREENK